MGYQIERWNWNWISVYVGSSHHLHFKQHMSKMWGHLWALNWIIKKKLLKICPCIALQLWNLIRNINLQDLNRIFLNKIVQKVGVCNYFFTQYSCEKFSLGCAYDIIRNLIRFWMCLWCNQPAQNGVKYFLNSNESSNPWLNFWKTTAHCSGHHWRSIYIFMHVFEEYIYENWQKDLV